MTDIRAEAHAAAQRAWHDAIDYHVKHHRWSPVLDSAIHAAERWVDWTEAAESLPEYVLDALHEATYAEMVELAEADVPLAFHAPIAETELRALFGDR